MNAAVEARRAVRHGRANITNNRRSPSSVVPHHVRRAESVEMKPVS